MDLEKLLYNLPKEIEMKEGKNFFMAGLCIRYRTLKNEWTVGYGTGGNNKYTATAPTIELAIEEFMTKMKS